MALRWTSTVEPRTARLGTTDGPLHTEEKRGREEAAITGPKDNGSLDDMQRAQSAESIQAALALCVGDDLLSHAVLRQRRRLDRHLPQFGLDDDADAALQKALLDHALHVARLVLSEARVGVAVVPHARDLAHAVVRPGRRRREVVEDRGELRQPAHVEVLLHEGPLPPRRPPLARHAVPSAARDRAVVAATASSLEARIQCGPVGGARELQSGRERKE